MFKKITAAIGVMAFVSAFILAFPVSTFAKERPCRRNCVVYQDPCNTCCGVSIEQSNNALVSNSISVSLSTGGNSVDGKEGTVTTGDTTVRINVTNNINSNFAVVH